MVGYSERSVLQGEAYGGVSVLCYCIIGTCDSGNFITESTPSVLLIIKV